MSKSNKSKRITTEKSTVFPANESKLLSIKQLQSKIIGVSDRHLRRIANSDSEKAKKIKKTIKEVEVLALQNQSKLIQELKTIVPIK